MDSINQLGISTAQQTQNNIQSPISKISSVTTYEKTIGTENAQPRAQTQVSSLSRQLSDAAIRATRRDASNSRNGLAAIALSTVDKLLGSSYQADKAAHDAGAPVSDTRNASLRRIKQRTFPTAKASIHSREFLVINWH